MRISGTSYLVLSLLLCLVASGCGDDEPGETNPGGSANSTKQTPQKNLPAPRKAAGLIGTWMYSQSNGSVRLDIRSASELVFDGDPASYRRVGDTLHVTADGQTTPYPIALSGDQLVITFPGGQRLTFKRTGGSGSSGGQTAASSGGTSGLNNPRYLTVTLMNFGSSSGGGSSYARTTRVTFDGRGSFVVRNETNFSSGSGGYYNNPVIAQGTYRINGNRVIMNFSDGETGVAQIKVRQNDGRITELTYEGDLYGPIP
ncbi:MAG: hypothetical protein HN350_20370 [Phycisphaerales bacterium]|jgi:hypothetical protein|nr:hypothetical protein [Phycisphaerales bacterium]